MTSSNSAKHLDIAQLDSLTGGAFTAATAGDRASRIREWLQGNPSADLLAEVFRELSVKDKGAAKLVRERLDEAKRAKGQELLAAEWVARAQALIDTAKLNIADALAWRRDAAKAGAPLGELLASDAELQGIAVEYGFRIADTERFVAAVKPTGLAVEPRVTQLVDPPSPEVMTEMIDTVAREMTQ